MGNITGLQISRATQCLSAAVSHLKKGMSSLIPFWVSLFPQHITPFPAFFCPHAQLIYLRRRCRAAVYKKNFKWRLQKHKFPWQSLWSHRSWAVWPVFSPPTTGNLGHNQPATSKISKPQRSQSLRRKALWFHIFHHLSRAWSKHVDIEEMV